MLKFIVGFILGIVIATAVVAVADSSYIGSNSIWNKVFNSGTNTISIQGV